MQHSGYHLNKLKLLQRNNMNIIPEQGHLTDNHRHEPYTSRFRRRCHRSGHHIDPHTGPITALTRPAPQGADAMTTRQVAARAGVAVGTLYQYFPDRDAILMHLASQIMDEEVDRTTRQLASLYRHPLKDLMAALYEHSIEVERRMQSLGRDFHRRHARHLNFGLSLKDKISTQPQNTDTLISTTLRMLVDHRDEVGETDRDLASFMMVRCMRNVMTTLVEERPDLLTSPSLAPMLTRLAMAIFAGEPPDADDPEVGQGHFLRGLPGGRRG